MLPRQHLVDNNLDDAAPGNTSDKSTFSEILKPRHRTSHVKIIYR